MDAAHNTVHICRNPDDLSRKVAQRWLEVSEQANRSRGHFHVALSGGSTPQLLYRQLASPAFIEMIAWHTTHVYFGDERCVPPNHPDSNYRMAHEALLRHVPIPHIQVHRIEAEQDDPELCASRYAQCLKTHLPATSDGEKFLDLVLLGLGPDGHIASLFPDTDILNEHTRWVAPVYVAKLQAWRISMTFKALGLARHVIILVAGDSKADIIAQVLGNRPHMTKYPVEMLRIADQFEWYLDTAAAKDISIK